MCFDKSGKAAQSTAASPALPHELSADTTALAVERRREEATWM
jgi:hypothetical protein